MRRTAIVLTAVALFAAACGGDGGSLLGPGTTAADAPATSVALERPGDTTEPTGVAPPGTDPGTQPTMPGAGDGAEAPEIEALLEVYQTEPLRLTYLVDDGDQIITLSQDPTQDPPVWAMLEGIDGADGKFVTIGDLGLVCEPGGGCIEIPGGGMGAFMMGPALFGLMMAEGMMGDLGLSVEQGTQTVAGRGGVCFTFRPGALYADEDVELIRQCIDSEFGFILIIEVREAGETEVETVMELIEFGRPRPEDFEPSGPVMTMPSP
jgi:hypothetical protein